MSRLEIKPFRDFRDFVNHIVKHHEQTNNILWRGQSNSKWHLQPTLVRICLRDKKVKDPILPTIHPKLSRWAEKQDESFLNGLQVFEVSRENLDHGQRKGLLRHQGGQSMVLDWTRAPFVAAFFAFSEIALSEKRIPKDAKVAVWGVKVGAVHAAVQIECAEAGSDVVVFDPMLKPIPDNPRIIAQQGVLTTFKCKEHYDLDRWVEDQPIDAINNESWMYKFTIPAREFDSALTILNKMNINFATLFPDVHGAALHATLYGILQNYEIFK